MHDYARIAAAIRRLDQDRRAQPSLADLAAACGLRGSHFHRLFHRWAGVTPKDFLQCLTAGHATARLRADAPVLEAALDAGLSGPGRLHDLLVNLEAATPGEVKRGGLGLAFAWGRASSPFGWCTLAWSERGVCHLAFHDRRPGTALPREARDDWPHALFTRDDPAAARLADRVFRPGPPGAPLRAFVRGSAFRLRVWRALLRIPEGGLASYRALAAAVGQPRAARAVGSACAANPVAYLIPCHRVIRETGVVRGYRWGTERKRVLLAREACPRVP